MFPAKRSSAGCGRRGSRCDRSSRGSKVSARRNACTRGRRSIRRDTDRPSSGRRVVVVVVIVAGGSAPAASGRANVVRCSGFDRAGRLGG